MKILVTGSRGQLGHDVMCELMKRGHQATGVDMEEMDITDEGSVNRVMEEIEPEAVIHCAAWTAVDAAEENVETCRQVNALGTEYLAKACAKFKCKIMYISTDYIFDGKGTRPWEPEDPVIHPLNVYGMTKYEGEQAIQRYVDQYFIVRIAWVFGSHGKNFVRTMLNLGKTHEQITVVNDQFGTPTYTYDLARLLADMMETEQFGKYHVTNEGGYLTWYDFACEIFHQAGIDVKVLPVSSDEYPSKAKRPSNSRLSKRKLLEKGFLPLPDWKDALHKYLLDLGEIKE